MEIAGILVIAGIVFAIVTGISQKHGFSGPVGMVLGVLLIPAIIAIFWRSATVFGWWTILIFVTISLILGFALVPVRRSNPGALVQMQPLFGLSAVALAVGCWFV